MMRAVGIPSSDRPPSGPRDRDEQGRARSARPRDALGRPLARDRPGVAPLAEIEHLGPDASLNLAQRLLDAGRPFQAHEVLEEMWKAAAPAERNLWQGLAQLAVGLTHALRGNRPGAVALLRRGAERLEPYALAPAAPNSGPALPGPHGLDLAGLLGWTAATLERLSDADTGEPEPLRLRRLPG